jgi:hypothetical protein
MGSYVWTHVAAGELLEGCNLFGANQVIIEDDVWLVGNVVVSPGIVLRKGTIVLAGSVVTKDTETKKCYAGVPAKDITDKVVPYHAIELQEKYEIMHSFAKGFVESLPNCRKLEDGYDTELGAIIFRPSLSGKLNFSKDTLIITKEIGSYSCSDNLTIFDLSTKLYTKRLTPIEIKFMRFLGGFRARFLPMK